jgi:phytanoyl-CoA hydroxylase
VSDKSFLINKIGHALHDLDPVFSSYSYQPLFRRILSDLGYMRPQIVQSMYILKGPYIGGEVSPHQDSTYIITTPKSCIGFWLALEAADKHNACLYAVPGSHHQGTLTFWERSGSKMEFSSPNNHSTTGGVCLEVEAGTVVLLHGDLVHWSAQNQSSQSRHAYAMHVVDAQHEWSPKNWLQRSSELPFRDWADS